MIRPAGPPAAVDAASGRKTTRLRRLLESTELEFILEAHNGLSARIVEEAGFRGIWGSGLTLAAQFGVRDSNEASWTQILEMLEFMTDATSIPILLDGDTGYGNFNNVRRLVAKLEQRGVAGVCIEDKLFPKTNSFLDSRLQALADVDEFCGKIRAGIDARSDPDFVIVARVEALIAGHGVGEALRRAEAYHAAGADAILVHSKRPAADEIIEFMRSWDRRAPVVVVPTKYWRTRPEVFRECGVSVVVWANQLLRAAIPAMQETARTIQREEALLSVEGGIAAVDEVFRLQGEDELREAERRYLPRTARNASAIVLAASRGIELGELTRDKPKAMIVVRRKPLLAHIVESYAAARVRDVTVVRGYGKTAVDVAGVSFVDNDDHETTGELVSFGKAIEGRRPHGDTVVSYGDVLFKHYIVDELLETPGDFVIAVDTAWRESKNRGRVADWVACSHAPSRSSFSSEVSLRRISPELAEHEIHGEWMGFLKLSPRGLEVAAELVRDFLALPDGRRAAMDRLLEQVLARGHDVRVIYSSGHWLDVDSLEDALEAGEFR